MVSSFIRQGRRGQLARLHFGSTEVSPYRGGDPAVCMCFYCWMHDAAPSRRWPRKHEAPSQVGAGDGDDIAFQDVDARFDALDHLHRHDAAARGGSHHLTTWWRLSALSRVTRCTMAEWWKDDQPPTRAQEKRQRQGQAKQLPEHRFPPAAVSLLQRKGKDR